MRILISVESTSGPLIDIFGLFSPDTVGYISAVYFGFGLSFTLAYMTFGWLASLLHHLETGDPILGQPPLGLESCLLKPVTTREDTKYRDRGFL